LGNSGVLSITPFDLAACKDVKISFKVAKTTAKN